jgi:triacylglycerol esterase/lipase EstA (alpha/beta hydrolase family)
MDGPERSAAVQAAGSAVARVTRTAGETHAAVVDVVRGALAPLGPAARVPVEASALFAQANYATVAGAARAIARAGAPAAAATAGPAAVPASTQPGAVGWLAALSAAFGDRMVVDADLRALTVSMAVRADARPVLPQDLPDGLVPRPTLVVLLHGLGGHEAQWDDRCLAAAAGEGAATPVTVRYTTGQPIADSGAELAALLEQLVAHWPVVVERIVLVGHSMGGLAIRAALAHPGSWRGLVTDAVTLGTPHTGAPLERGARRALAVLSAFPVAAPLADLGDERSAGIKDLALGDVAPPSPDVAWHVVAGTVGPDSLAGVLGDGMVSVASAWGVPEELAVRRDRIRGADHMDLLEHPQVAELLRDVVAAGSR